MNMPAEQKRGITAQGNSTDERLPVGLLEEFRNTDLW